MQLPFVPVSRSSPSSEATSKLQAARYQAWLQQSTDALCTLNLSGEVTSATSQFCRVMGLPTESLVESVLWDQFERRDMEGGDRLRQSWQRVIQGGMPQILMTYDVRENLPIALQWHLQPVRVGGEILEVQAWVKPVDTLRHFPVKDSDSDQFRQLAAHLQQVFWVYELEARRVVYVSPACQTVLGQSREACERRSFQDWLAEIHPGDLPAVLKASRQPLRGHSTEVTYRLLGLDGEVRWLMTRAVPVRNEDGRIDRIVAMTEDVTERKKQESWLRLLESVVVNANDAVVITEAEPVQLPGPHIVYVNQAFTRMMGYQPEEIVGKTPRILQGPNTDVETLQRVRSALKSWQPVLVEIINYHKNGSEIWIELSIFPVADQTGRYYYWVAIQRDITQRKQAETAIQQQSWRSQILADLTLKIRRSLQLNEILSTTVTEVRNLLQVDRVLMFQRMGQGWGRVLSESVNSEVPSLLGQELEEVDLFPEPIQLYERSMVHGVERLDHPEWRSRGARTLQQMGVRSILVIPVLQRESVWGWLIAHHCLGHHSWSNFETELLQQLMSPLEVAITHSQLLQALQENNELKSHVVSTTSHEFRTPLSTILSSADLLEFYGDRVTPDKQLEHIQRIQNAAVNMNNLLSDILLIERADAKKLKCEPTNIEVRSFCHALLTELRSGVEDSTSPVNFEVNFEGQSLETAMETAIAARLDEKLLRQILMNLLTNALKYSQGKPMVQLLLTVTQQTLTFTVSDRGMGIPKVDLDRLFEPFQRGSNVGTVPGNGLGMAIVKQSVDIHGGEVTVESEVGTGTVVTVRLPRMKNEE
jgi:PAS domain S-box-containing protein